MLPRDRQIVERYLARNAEPEAREVLPGTATWSQVLVVPVFDESADFLQGYQDALNAAPGRVLVVVVVNAPAHASIAQQAANQSLWSALGAAGPGDRGNEPPLRLVSTDVADLVLVDRSSPSRLLPAGQGVGLARKIGLDLALSLFASGRVESPALAWSDADATLPRRFFEAVGAHGDAAIVAAPYRHLGSSDSELERATCAYELWLRYYVLGLHHAGSPYALHTIGSTLCTPALAYAQVRGVPKRTAGEDFHIVNKGLKVGDGVRLRGDPVLLKPRYSERVLFGTGPAVRRISHGLVDESKFELLHPQVFGVLAQVQRGLRQIASDGNVAGFDSVLASLPGVAREVVEAFFSRTRLLDKIDVAVSQCVSKEAAWRRLCDNFDGLQTLRLIHRLRDGGYGRRPWREAMSEAPFIGREFSDLEAARAWAEGAEAGLPGRVGPSVS